jgi:hypothetical protein
MGRAVAMGCNPTAVRGPVQPGLFELAEVNERTSRRRFYWIRVVCERNVANAFIPETPPELLEVLTDD